MDLKTLSSHWDRWGASDPLWSVLSVPGRRFNGWDETEFFKTGLQEIAGIFSELDALGLSVTPGRALDFGCGVGRLTSALADRFTKVDGVDIAPSMVAHSQRRFGTDPRMSFFLLEDDNLSLFPSGRYDFIYTAHVLQHMEPRYSQRYVQEFVRVLAPAGVAVVEITTVPYRGTSRQQLIIRAVRRRLPANLTRRLALLLPDRLKQRLRGSAAEEEPVMEMYGVPEPTMRRWMEQAGGRVVEVLDWARIADPGTDWVRRIFVLTRLPHQ